MKTGMYDNRLGFHELPFYNIEELCEALVKTATSKNKDYRAKYEEYKKNITRFSPAFEFCMHELGWMLYDPFCVGKDEVLFSNGERCYLASVDYVSRQAFDRKSIKNEDVGYPRLEDQVVGYDEDMNPENIDKGIINDKGFVSSKFVDSLDTLAEIIVMNENMSSEEAYNDYMKSKEYYSNKLDYLTSKKNVIAAKKLDNGSVSVRFVSENDGKVQNFLDRLTEEGKIADFTPRVNSGNRARAA